MSKLKALNVLALYTKQGEAWRPMPSQQPQQQGGRWTLTKATEPSEPTGDPGLVLPAWAEEIVSMTPVGKPTPRHISPEAGVESQGLQQDTEMVGSQPNPDDVLGWSVAQGLSGQSCRSFLNRHKDPPWPRADQGDPGGLDLRLSGKILD